MNPMLRKVALIAASLGLLVSLFVALRGSDDENDAAPPATAPTTTAAADPPPATTEAPPARVTIRLRVVGGQPAGGIRRAKVKQGRQVAIVTTADVSDHIHLHGYDLMADVAPGSPARIAFTADVPGRFEIELEDRGVLLADLSVTP
jgi:hypothetical protein